MTQSLKTLHFSVRAAETSGRGKSIYVHDKNGKVAAAYHALTKEMLEIERKNERFGNDAVSKDGKLTDEVILSIMQEEKPNQKEQFKMRLQLPKPCKRRLR